ncbi:MAG: fluoride efflux transporter CrcB [Halobacteriovorax sp.]|nr:fluoride efflux transporter CrcB [Halobacteriovorax sp.]
MAISLKLATYIFLAGGIGANLRWVLSLLINKFSGKIWTGTLAVNLIGCLLFFLVSRFQPNESELNLIFKVGLLGSLTTFSTFTFEIVSLIKAGQTSEALLVLCLNILFGVIIGIGIIR